VPVDREPNEMFVIDVVVLLGTTTCTSKKALESALNAPVLAAAPAFVPPEATTLKGLV
jgi:hypothetical protein